MNARSQGGAMIVNEHQSEAWNGYEGAHWAGHPDRYDAVNSGFNDHLLRHVADGDRVLDVGCGTGQISRLAARRARHVTGVDLSAPMLETARRLAAAEGLGNVAFERGDAQVHPIEPGAYDVATSRFGIMFFADPVAAFANIGRALRPGGRVAFLGLRDPGDLGTVLAAVAAHLPEAPPSPDGTSPLSLADPGRAAEVFTAAGFTGVRAEAVEAEQVLGRDARDAADFLAAGGPLRHHLRHSDAGSARRALAALEPALRPFERDGAVRLRVTATLITATQDTATLDTATLDTATRPAGGRP
ncbi:class I SAM-dependent methyltransferase [Nonomuraea sp. ATR24]|uniref:class I SAM-dependent methyltransferase n=1 Tax=Nonomuraea sp. ATR24 TaxID=1676744 RepID=UPI0035C1B33F